MVGSKIGVATVGVVMVNREGLYLDVKRGVGAGGGGWVG